MLLVSRSHQGIYYVTISYYLTKYLQSYCLVYHMTLSGVKGLVISLVFSKLIIIWHILSFRYANKNTKNTHLFNLPSLSTWRAIRVILIDMMQKGKFCVSCWDSLYTSSARLCSLSSVTRYSRLTRPNTPQPRRSVAGSRPGKKQKLHETPILWNFTKW